VQGRQGLYPSQKLKIIANYLHCTVRGILRKICSSRTGLNQWGWGMGEGMVHCRAFIVGLQTWGMLLAVAYPFFQEFGLVDTDRPQVQSQAAP